MARKITYRDESLPHQIVEFITPRGWLAISCNCMRKPRGGYVPIAQRVRWDSVDDMLAIYRKHLEPAELHESGHGQCAARNISPDQGQLHSEPAPASL